jgi:hypothetical protein
VLLWVSFYQLLIPFTLVFISDSEKEIDPNGLAALQATEQFIGIQQTLVHLLSIQCCMEDLHR